MKKNNRIKLIAPSIRTRAEAEAILGAIRGQTIARNQLLLDKEEAIMAIDARLGPRIESLQKELDQKTELLRGWAEANPEDFAGKKSVEWTHGKFGWRIGTHELVKRTKKKWDDLVEIVAAALGTGYIRTKKEVDRAEIIRDRDKLPAEAMRECGLSVVQEEAFFVDPQIEEPSNRQIAEAA